MLCCQAKATGTAVRGLEFQYQQPHSSRFRSCEVICKQDLTPAGSPLPRVPSTLHRFPCPVGWGEERDACLTSSQLLSQNLVS